MDMETVEQIVALLGAYPVAEITVERDGARISARRAISAASAAPAAPMIVQASPEPAAVTEAETAGLDLSPGAAGDEAWELTSPMVGLFHPLDPPIGYGAILQPGDMVGNIEAMKLMNEVRADRGGRVIEVLIEEGAPVEYGQPLYRLTPV